METQIKDTFEAILNAPKYLPCISIIMPFEPKIGLKKEIDYKLKIAKNKIEKELESNYPEDKYMPVLNKLKLMLEGLNYNTHKKSVAIFISPLIEKIYYLDISVEEKIIIDDSFEIRDLIYSKKEIHKYLLVVLSNKWTKIYLGNTTKFIRITSTMPDNIDAYKNDTSEKVANFSDEKKRKEILINKFLMHTDNGLSILLKTYKLPIFIMGTPKTLGQFKSLTHNSQHVIDYIHGNFEEKSEAELQEVMKPYIKNWKIIHQKRLMGLIDDAYGKNKLAVGVNEVWKASVQNRGKLLIVEKNFFYPAQHGANKEVIYKRDTFLNSNFFIKDAVDDIIEKVIESGGDIEFVDEGILNEYQKIVLLEYY